jgi:hypothetical protein
MRPSATRVWGLNLGVIGEMSELRVEFKDGIVLQTCSVCVCVCVCIYQSTADLSPILQTYLLYCRPMSFTADLSVLQTYLLEHLQLPQLHRQEMDAVIREL